jgi:hypothetical protein
MADEPKAIDTALVEIQGELAKTSASARRRLMEKFALAALGSIPWVGGFISAAASIKTDERGIKKDNLQTQWLEEHTKKMEQLGRALADVTARFESLGEQIDERIQSEEYLGLVRHAFAAWDRAQTDEKRRYVGNLVSNAAGSRICSDDVVRLFVGWLDLYHEAHLAVIREIFQNPGSTRHDIWMSIDGQTVREDSAEADLFKLMIRELSTGGVIRQARETTVDGDFIRRRTPGRRGPTPTTIESAFEDTKPYVLTELGKQFVHYTMSEVIARIGNSAPKENRDENQ